MLEAALTAAHKEGKRMASKPTAQDALTEEQLDALLAQVNRESATGSRNYALLLVMADAGLRISEALALTTRDLRREAGRITHVDVRNGKGRKARRVAATDRLALAITLWLERKDGRGIDGAEIFVTVKQGGRATGRFAAPGQALVPGRVIHASYVAVLLDRLADQAGIEHHISPHTLRHTFATRLLRATGNLEATRKALGHASADTTSRIYAHLVQDDVDAAIERLPCGVDEAKGDDEWTELEKTLTDEEKELFTKLLTGRRV